MPCIGGNCAAKQACPGGNCKKLPGQNRAQQQQRQPLNVNANQGQQQGGQQMDVIGLLTTVVSALLEQTGGNQQAQA